MRTVRAGQAKAAEGCGGTRRDRPKEAKCCCVPKGYFLAVLHLQHHVQKSAAKRGTKDGERISNEKGIAKILAELVGPWPLIMCVAVPLSIIVHSME